MSKTIQSVVLLFLANLPKSKYEQFNKALELYKQLPNKEDFQLQRLNRIGFTDSNLEFLLYDLKKLCKISDIEIQKAKTETAPKMEVVGKESKKEASYKELSSKEDFQPLREEYPFLNDKDCPDILYAVVGRKIAAFKRYEENHAKLQQILDGTLELPKVDEDNLAKLVEEDFNENIALHKELQFYKDNAKILGEHPLFEETIIKREVDEMTKDELVKFINSSVKYFHDQKKKLEKASGDETKIENINRLVSNREFKLGLVKEKLGVSE